ncbi:MAG: hypothetical protein WC686_03380 [Candidatus Shapirobacteria bacterium]|jgi:hypothetical protein
MTVSITVKSKEGKTLSIATLPNSNNPAKTCMEIKHIVRAPNSPSDLDYNLVVTGTPNREMILRRCAAGHAQAWYPQEDGSQFGGHSFFVLPEQTLPPFVTREGNSVWIEGLRPVLTPQAAVTILHAQPSKR